jgi:hypothetical protein
MQYQTSSLVTTIYFKTILRIIQQGSLSTYKKENRKPLQKPIINYIKKRKK